MEAQLIEDVKLMLRMLKGGCFHNGGTRDMSLTGEYKSMRKNNLFFN